MVLLFWVHGQLTDMLVHDPLVGARVSYDVKGYFTVILGISYHTFLSPLEKTD